MFAIEMPIKVPYIGNLPYDYDGQFKCEFTYVVFEWHSIINKYAETENWISAFYRVDKTEDGKARYSAIKSSIHILKDMRKDFERTYELEDAGTYAERLGLS